MTASTFTREVRVVRGVGEVGHAERERPTLRSRPRRVVGVGAARNTARARGWEQHPRDRRDRSRDHRR